MSEVEVRPARAEDRPAVLAFCEHTWDDGDYIAAVWEEWLADADGALLVAALDGQPVGVIHLRMLSADEAWLEGIRVDPTVRGQGIGRRMTARALVAARERGATVARLFTDSSNAASQALIARLGFERVAEFARYKAPASTLARDVAVPTGATLRTPGPDEMERLWVFLEGSNLVPLNGGLLVEDWIARALTSPLLERRLAAGEVWVLEAWEAIQALAIVLAEPQAETGPRLAVQYLDGTPEGVGRLALALRSEAAKEGLATVRVRLADSLILRDAMDGAGFTHGSGGLWCYARQLEPSTSVPPRP